MKNSYLSKNSEGGMTKYGVKETGDDSLKLQNGDKEEEFSRKDFGKKSETEKHNESKK